MDRATNLDQTSACCAGMKNEPIANSHGNEHVCTSQHTTNGVTSDVVTTHRTNHLHETQIQAVASLADDHSKHGNDDHSAIHSSSDEHTHVANSVANSNKETDHDDHKHDASPSHNAPQNHDQQHSA